jgi:hypothetical protein
MTNDEQRKRATSVNKEQALIFKQMPLTFKGLSSNLRFVKQMFLKTKMAHAH